MAKHNCTWWKALRFFTLQIPNLPAMLYHLRAFDRQAGKLNAFQNALFSGTLYRWQITVAIVFPEEPIFSPSIFIIGVAGY